MKPLHKGEPSEAQLRWLRAINDFWTVDHYYPGMDDLIEALGLRPVSLNAAREMTERLEAKGWVEWPLNKKRERSLAKSDRLSRRANSIRLTPLGLEVLKENS